MFAFHLKCSTLEKLYLDEKQSMSAIGKGYGVSGEKVKERMVECGIPIRSASEAQKLTARRAEIDPALLNYWYWELEMSTTDIARKLHLNQSTISNRLDRARPVGFWKGNKRRKRYKHVRSIDGYWMVKIPEHPLADSQGYVKEAVLKWEKHYKKPFPEDCLIHYINDDLDDLSIGNIRPMTNSEHSRFHAYARRREGFGRKGKCSSGKLVIYMATWDYLQRQKAIEAQIRRFDYVDDSELY